MNKRPNLKSTNYNLIQKKHKSLANKQRRTSKKTSMLKDVLFSHVWRKNRLPYNENL